MHMKGTIIYIGNFEMPNKNAAAHRVLGNAKVFRRLGYKVVFVGAYREGHSTEPINSIDDFDIYNRPYPRNFKQWITHLSSNSYVKKIINQYSDTKLIICYNAPAIATFRIKRYAQTKGIKVVGDYTEWYGGTKISSFRSLMAKIDSELRMRVIAKKLDGLIVISNYLKNYYAKKRSVVQIPPLVDLSEDKWLIVRRTDRINDDNIRITYAGNSGQKDRLDLLLETLANASNKKFTLYVIGQTKEQCILQYGKKVETFINQLNRHVQFLGWCTHQEVLQYLVNSDLCMFIRQSTLQNKAGFPTKYVEATTCGVPTITSDVGDIRLYIENGVNGILINEGEYKDVPEILMLGKDKYHQMKQNLDKSMFSYENFISITESWLNSMEL